MAVVGYVHYVWWKVTTLRDKTGRKYLKVHEIIKRYYTLFGWDVDGIVWPYLSNIYRVKSLCLVELQRLLFQLSHFSAQIPSFGQGRVKRVQLTINQIFFHLYPIQTGVFVKLKFLSKAKHKWIYRQYTTWWCNPKNVLTTTIYSKSLNKKTSMSVF